MTPETTPFFTDLMAAMRQAMAPVRLLVDGADCGTELLLRPNGHGGYEAPLDLADVLAKHREGPRRKKGTAVMLDLRSFQAHVQRFRDGESALFAKRGESPSLTCVFDYHHAVDLDAPDWHGAKPRWGEHRAHYAFPLSAQWKTWQAAAGKSLGQQELAELLEENVGDLIEPTVAGERTQALLAKLHVTAAAPAAVLAVSRGLTVRANTEVRNAVVLSSGEVQLTYNTQHTDERGQPLSVPSAFLIAIPVFEGGEAFIIPVRLRYRHHEGRITWALKLIQADTIRDTAVNEACEATRDVTGLPLLFGSPE